LPIDHHTIFAKRIEPFLSDIRVGRNSFRFSRWEASRSNRFFAGGLKKAASIPMQYQIAKYIMEG